MIFSDPWQTFSVPAIVPAAAGTELLTIKSSVLVAFPPAVVTVTFPVAVGLIVATIVVPLFDVIEVAAVPLILTSASFAPLKLVPFIVIEIVEPAQLPGGLKLVMVGGGRWWLLNKCCNCTRPNYIVSGAKCAAR